MTINAATVQALNDAAVVVKDALTAAQKAFTKNPSATNWQVCLRAMFTHQQIAYAIRSHSVDRYKLAFDLSINPLGDWQNVICRATTGADIDESLQEFAVF
jgi:hypothetical protein